MSVYLKIALAVLGLCILGCAYYLISPIFRVVEVEDEAPVEVVQESAVVDETENEETSEELEDPRVSQIIDTPEHPASGTVRVIETEEGTVIRYEDFETINGPSLRVYLANDLEATDYVDIGPVKGTKGNINYLVPEGVDISDYKYVMYWCVPFSVLFNYAEIN